MTWDCFLLVDSGCNLLFLKRFAGAPFGFGDKGFIFLCACFPDPIFYDRTVVGNGVDLLFESDDHDRCAFTDFHFSFPFSFWFVFRFDGVKHKLTPMACQTLFCIFIL